jgi:hypothetical protein
MKGPASVLLEGALCTVFSREAMPKSSISQRNLHTPFWSLMFQLPPLQSPRKVLETSEEGLPPEDRLKRRYALDGERASVGKICPGICIEFLYFEKDQ